MRKRRFSLESEASAPREVEVVLEGSLVVLYLAAESIPPSLLTLMRIRGPEMNELCQSSKVSLSFNVQGEG